MLARRWPLTGLLLLPMAWYLIANAERAISRRPAAEPRLQPRPRWTPVPSVDPSLPPLALEPSRTAGAESPPASGTAGTARATSPAAAPRAAPADAPTGSIPNVDSDGLLLALTRAGLECSSVSLDTGGLTWTCSADTANATYLVVVHGARTDTITRLRATVTRAATDFIAARFLAGMARLAYSGAEPARAADWVNRSLAVDGSITIGPVRFELSGAPGARTLDLAAEGPRP